MNGNEEFRKLLLRDRYLLKSEETWEDLCERVAVFLSDIDFEDDDEHKRKYADYKSMMVERKFLPSSPTLMASGTPYPMLSSCFILPTEDSLEAIMETVKTSTLVNARGGGLGHNVTPIRPQGSMVKSTEKSAMGPLGVVRILDAMTEVIKQGGRRRGANLACLCCDHKDIMKFISCKSDESKINNFNLSVLVTDDFIDRVKAGDGKACKIWNAVIDNSFSKGEPGVLFYDAMNRDSAYTKHGLDVNCTNPCGEICGPSWTSCNLGSINLSNFVDDDGRFDKRGFRKIIPICVEMLNDVLDHNQLPHPKLTEFAINYRPIGLGIFGFSDALIKMGIVYGSEESYELAHYVGSTLKSITDKTRDKYCNVTSLAIAPTGSISILAKCSWSIEPIFDYEMDRTYVDNDDITHNFKLVHPLWQEHRQSGKYNPEVFVKSMDLPYQVHLNMQAIFQKYVDSSISKTIMLPHDISIEETRNIYIKAHELGLKGITIYRDMSRSGQVYKSSVVPTIAAGSTGKVLSKRSRPKSLPGITHKCRTPDGSFYVTCTHKDGTAFEVFATSNIDNRDDPSKGHESIVNIEALTRMTSLSLRSGVSPVKIIEQLEKTKNQSMLSMPIQIASVIKDIGSMDTSTIVPAEFSRLCPVCTDVELKFTGDCWDCPKCGWSKCAG